MVPVPLVHVSRHSSRSAKGEIKIKLEGRAPLLERLPWPRWITRPRWPLIPTPVWFYQSLPYLAWGYVLLLLLTAGGMRLLGDDWWPATVLLYGPRWVLLAPVPLLALAAALLRPRLFLPAILSVFVMIGPVMGYHLGWRGWFADDTRHDLRLITFNVEGAVNSFAPAIPRELKVLDPDVIVLQECPIELEQMAPIAFRGWAVIRHRNLCLVSRFPVAATEQLEEINVGSTGGTGAVSAYTLTTPWGPVELVNVHLETPRKALGPWRARGSQANFASNSTLRDIGSAKASQWAARRGPDRIVAGDFNLTAESAIYRRNWSDCTNAFSEVGKGFGYTRVLNRFSARIDHVLTCGDRWVPVRVEIGLPLGSDHRPLIVDLKRR